MKLTGKGVSSRALPSFSIADVDLFCFGFEFGADVDVPAVRL